MNTDQRLEHIVAILHKLASTESTTDFDDTLSRNEEEEAKIHHDDKHPAIEPIVQIFQRLQSKCSVLTIENDQQTQEIDGLRNEIGRLEEHASSLSNQVQHLQRMNAKLQAKVKRKTKERNFLAKHVRDALKKTKELTESQRELDDLKSVYKLQMHEHHLQHRQIRTRGSSIDSGIGSLSMEEDLESDQSSMSSSSSLFLDDGVPTLRIGLGDSHELPDSIVPSIGGPSYTLSFPVGTKLGLKIRAYAVEELEGRPQALISKEMLEGMHENEEEKKATGFHIGFNLDGLWKRKDPHEGKEKAFIVSGFDGFDSERNPEPRIGTRIVALDGEEVGGEWTMNLLQSKLLVLAEAETEAETFTVTFREDRIPDKILGALEATHSKNQSKDHKHDGPSSFGLGFLKFGQRKRTASTTEQSQDPSLALDETCDS